MQTHPTIDPETLSFRYLIKSPVLQISVILGLMSIIGSSLIPPVIPYMIIPLGVSREIIGLVLSMYTLPSIFVSIPVGYLTDRYGRKPFLAIGVLLYSIAGSVSGFAPDFNTLIIFRFLQGIGGAILITLSFTILSDVFQGQHLGRAITLYFVIFNTGIALAPLIGGVLGTIHWRFPFFRFSIAIPFALFIAVKRKMLPNDPSSTKVAKNPSQPSQLPKQSSSFFNAALLASMCSGFTVFFLLIGSYSTYYPIFLTSKYGTPTYLIVIHLSSSSIIGAVAALYIGRGAENHSKAKLVAMGFILCSIAFALLALIRGYGIALMFPMCLITARHIEGVQLMQSHKLLLI